MIVDLFAGPRGWSEGLRMLGLSDIGLEWDWSACKTAVAAGHATIQTDVAQYPTAPFKGRVKGKISSPPCQPWSRAGKRTGIEDQAHVQQAVHDLAHGRDTRAELKAACKDERSLLAAEPMRWLYDLRPEWVCMEQVPDVLPLWRQYAEHLRAWGYSVWTGGLNAADYGVPQTRKRAILIASRVRRVTAPAPTHSRHDHGDTLFGESLEPWVSMAEALGWTTGLTVNTRGARTTPGGNEFPADQPSWALTEKTRSWVLHTNRDQRPDGSRQTSDPYTAPAPSFTAKAGGQWVLRTGNNTMKHSRTGSRRGEGGVVAYEREIGEPAPTLDTNVGNKWRLHNGEEKRPITVAEATAIQTFPADYPWQGTKTKQFEQIGNAVPPLLAAHVVSVATGIPLIAGLEVAV
ncbi:DNA cytosine methyltransferase [Streptomyces sp. NPDC057052]|uniref:DNA cytosine methyltransferase n=1 Tax=Streptomyces sp. NPDC057052 TaxID=3346010 RepID=UPI00363DD2A9